MKRHILRLRAGDPLFTALVDGRKSVETRAATIRFRRIVTGDILVFTCAGQRLERTVRRVQHFGTIAGLLAAYRWQDVVPLASSETEAKQLWYSFPGYRDKINQYGLMAFELT